jgi:phosphoglycerate kinase
LNCPIENGKVIDDFRIQQSLPSILELIKNKNKLIICAHLGRPGGKHNKNFSLRPVAQHLAELLNLKFVETEYKLPDYKIPHLIFYTGKITEDKHQKQINSIPEKDVVFLENLRFYEGEENNSSVFAKKLSALAEVYVNDAFGVDHRAAASVVGITKYINSYGGFLLEREIKFLDGLLRHPKAPFVVMTGGIKLSEKVGALENLGKKADTILVAGGVANLIFKTKGFEIGLSRVEESMEKTAMQIAKNYKTKLILPLDVVVADKDFKNIRCCLPYEVKKHEQILDSGPKTIFEFAKYIKGAKTIVWSGPLGLFEKKPFHHATFALARLIGGRGKGKAFVVAGGGDTVDAIRQAHQFEHIDHVSTGGGAMLDYLAGLKLPGIEALK